MSLRSAVRKPNTEEDPPVTSRFRFEAPQLKRLLDGEGALTNAI